MKHLIINGKTLAYHDVGYGPAILFGHSFLWDHRMWEAQVEALSAGFRCIVPDLWGHGESDNPPESSYTMAQTAADMVTLMRSLKVEHFTVAGLSIGGMWAIPLALKYPEMVDALILLDSDVGQEPAPTYEKYMAMLAAIENMNLIPPPISDQIAPGFFSPATIQNRPEILSAFLQSLTGWPTDKLSGMVTMGRAFVQRPCLLESLNQITCPTQIIVGEDDVYRPVHEAKRMHEEISGSRLDLVSDAGHISTIDQPDTVTKLMQDFLRSLR